MSLPVKDELLGIIDRETRGITPHAIDKPEFFERYVLYSSALAQWQQHPWQGYSLRFMSGNSSDVVIVSFRSVPSSIAEAIWLRPGETIEVPEGFDRVFIRQGGAAVNSAEFIVGRIKGARVHNNPQANRAQALCVSTEPGGRDHTIYNSVAIAPAADAVLWNLGSISLNGLTQYELTIQSVTDDPAVRVLRWGVRDQADAAWIDYKNGYMPANGSMPPVLVEPALMQRLNVRTVDAATAGSTYYLTVTLRLVSAF